MRRFVRLVAFALTLVAPMVATAQTGEKVVVENLSVDTGLGVYRVGRLEATGVNMNAAELAALLRGEGEGALHERLRRLEAKELYAPEIEHEVNMFGVRQTMVIREVRIQNVAGGRIGRAVTDWGRSSGGVEGQRFEGERGRMTIEDVDVAGAAQLFLTGATPDGKPVTLYGAVKLDHMWSKQPQAEIELRDLSARGVRMGPTATPLIETLREMARLDPAAKAPPQETIATMGKMFAAYRSFEVDESSAASMRMTIAEGSTRVAVTMGPIALEKWRDGVLGLAAMDDVRVSGDAFALHFDRYELADFDMRPTIDTLGRIAADPSLVETINPSAYVPHIGRIELTGLTVDTPDPDAKSRAPMRVGLGLFHLSREAAEAIRWKLALSFFSLSAASGDSRLKMLREIGYDELEGGAQMTIEYRPAANEIAITDLQLAETGSGEASATATFANVTEAIFTSSPKIAALAALPIAFKRGELRLTHSGLIDKLVAWRAKNAKKAPAQARADMIADATKALKGLGETPSAKAFVKALTDFMAKPAEPLTLRLTADPGVSAIDAASAEPKTELWKKVKVEAVRR